MADESAHTYSLARRDEEGRKEFWACLALRGCPGLGAHRINTLLTHFGSAYSAVRHAAHWADLGIPKQCATAFGKESWRQKAHQEWTAAKNSFCGILLRRDAEFPPLLRSIPDAPSFLYFLGDLGLLANPIVALVGTRACSEEGLKATVHIGRGLAEAGVTIVSGMAKGIDRVAHLTGLEGTGGSIGVLGLGIDMIYPRQNKDLYVLMRRKGLLLSEFPPGFTAEARCFPVRNRIISGLALAVVVIEAAVRSGSLNTARHALEQNRELMAVPGPVSASSARGCQELVRNGAKPVFRAADVLHEIAPHLAEHVRLKLRERDLTRFRPRVDEDASAAEEEALRTLVSTPGLLSWRTQGKETPPSLPLPEKDVPVAAHAPVDKNSVPVTERDVPGGMCGIPPELSEEERAFYTLVAVSPMHIDDICRTLGHTSKTISGLAAMLEVRGYITRLPGMMYIAGKI